MVSFEKPKYTFPFDYKDQISSLKKHKKHRSIPKKNRDSLLVCTWNIANLGLHKRQTDHYRIIAELLSWFDIIAIQEVHDDLSGLYKLEEFLGTEYDLIFTDKGGNDERAAYFYDANKVERLQMVGELAIPVAEHRHIKLPDIKTKFTGFDRNPFIVSFQFKEERFVLINAHLYFCNNKKAAKNRRSLEAYAIGRYADLRRNDKHTFTDKIIALGDFNIPKAIKGDVIFDALSKRGLTLPKYSTKLASSISTDAEYDQVMFFPNIKKKVVNNGVFDFDGVIFEELWAKSESDFKKYCRYYISDHRPMWVELRF